MAAALPEAKSLTAPVENASAPPEFARVLNAWNDQKSLGSALDAVSAAWAVGSPALAIEAARFVVSSRRHVPKISRRLAEQILEPGGTVKEDLDWELAKDGIKRNRLRLREDPRDVLALVDLARCYTSIGAKEKATRALQQAVALAPNHRFTLRSAVRFQVHMHLPDVALRILRESTRTRFDPWLVSADISVSALVGKTSRFVRTAKAMLADAAFAPVHLSELSSALATLELKAGNVKQAKRLFAKSLIDPTDNAVAQAEWASEHVGDVLLLPAHLANPLSFEARAMEAMNGAHWKAVVENGFAWHMDEPFSGRPVFAASFAAAVGLEDYSTSIRILDAGLLANPDDPGLLNNLAYAKACSGDLAGAIEALSRLKRASYHFEVARLANEGLINYRRGDPVAGAARYLAAIEVARERKDKELQARAAFFWLREEVREGGIVAGEALKLLDLLEQHLPRHEFGHLLPALRSKLTG